MTRVGPTVWIDDAADGGSDAGAWASHIAHTPHLAAQVAPDRAPEQDCEAND